MRIIHKINSSGAQIGFCERCRTSYIVTTETTKFHDVDNPLCKTYVRASHYVRKGKK